MDNLTFDITLVKKHPYITGAIVLIGGYILYKALTGGGVQSSGGDGQPSLPEQQLQASYSLQSAQLANAAEHDQLVAQVQQSQIDAANFTTSAQLKAFEVGAAVDLAKVQDTNATAVDISSIQADVARSAISADVEKTQINSDAVVSVYAMQSAIAERNSDMAYALAQKSDLKHRGSGGVESIISTIYGPAGIAAHQPESVAVAQASVYSSPAAILNGVGNIAGKVFGGLFGL